MSVNSVQFAFFIALLLVPFIQAQDADTKLAPLIEQQLSQTCVGCICEAASGCNTTVGCSGEVCGPFRITWAYWADSGKPTLNGEPNSAAGAWTRCVNDVFCAAETLKGYMKEYAQDCTGDGVVDCDDYVRIHRLGGYGCNRALELQYENKYRACMTTFGK